MQPRDREEWSPHTLNTLKILSSISLLGSLSSNTMSPAANGSIKTTAKNQTGTQQAPLLGTTRSHHNGSHRTRLHSNTNRRWRPSTATRVSMLSSWCLQTSWVSILISIKSEHWLLRRSRTGQEWTHSTWLRAQTKHREVLTLNTKEELATGATDLNLGTKVQTLEEII